MRILVRVRDEEWEVARALGPALYLGLCGLCGHDAVVLLDISRAQTDFVWYREHLDAVRTMSGIDRFVAGHRDQLWRLAQKRAVLAQKDFRAQQMMFVANLLAGYRTRSRGFNRKIVGALRYELARADSRFHTLPAKTLLALAGVALFNKLVEEHTSSADGTDARAIAASDPTRN